ncbi:MAG: Lrp/AsnC ligand binding domain-containing protein [Anaerolineales bacterium]|nr:Lrp/AsnC ligand binding domain-containing protein [Anaerolineales bacterium]
MKAFVLINIRTGEVRDVVRQLAKVEGVLEAHTTFGPYDAIAIVKATDINHLSNIINISIQPIPGITHTLTCLAGSND